MRGATAPWGRPSAPPARTGEPICGVNPHNPERTFSRRPFNNPSHIWTCQGTRSYFTLFLNVSVALDTGAASGIGQAIALAFIRESCRRIILIDLNSEGLQETKQLALEISSEVKVLICPCDISDEAAVNKVMETGMAKFGRLDYAVNCAGFPGGFAKTAEYVIEDFDRVQQVNVRGTWLCMKAQIQQMTKQTPLKPHKY